MVTGDTRQDNLYQMDGNIYQCGGDGLELAQFIDRTVKMLNANRFVGTCVNTPHKGPLSETK